MRKYAIRYCSKNDISKNHLQYYFPVKVSILKKIGYIIGNYEEDDEVYLDNVSYCNFINFQIDYSMKENNEIDYEKKITKK